MGFDGFLKIEGIPGESTDDKHKDWIEVLSFSHGVTQAATTASTGGARTGGRCDHADFSVTKVLDKASPKINLFCSNGKHINEVTVELCRAAEDKQKFMVWKMTDVIISSVAPGGSAHGSENLPMEQVSFNYGKMEWTYTETDHKTGKA
ncbi:MAG: type VI secretion system tube protein Hcp, partial [Planctomycetes bacterium]|nr:type VI secretion system tube protein Hcp [Planctomycetota bacterium]